MPACPSCGATHPAGTEVCPVAGTRMRQTGEGRGAEAPTAQATAPASAPAPLPDPLVGTTLAGRYLIARKIGEGGMGAVYEGKHTVIGKRVAIKVLLERLQEKRDLVARLLQEARLASSIGHENIVDVTDFGITDDGRSFVVMEFLEGESLAQLIMREAPLPVERCLRIVRQVASALSAAHAKGILHRDVKPENVYLVRRGDMDFVKVVDFGISKAIRPGEDNPELQRLTHTGMVLGTPLYMSPEQARGEEDVDHRADVWALGVMLSECLTGEVPFRANNYLGIISQVLTHEPLPPSKVRPELGISPAVDAVVMRAMEKDRSRRYQLVALLDQDIGRLLAGDQNVGAEEPSGPPEPARVAPRWHLAALAVLAVGAGLAAALAAGEDSPTAPAVVPASAKPAPAVPVLQPAAPASPIVPGATLPAPERTAGAATQKSRANRRRATPPPAVRVESKAPPKDEGEKVIPPDQAFR